MYVEKLTMKDFRCFEQAEVSFVYPGKVGLPKDVLDNVTLLMGINGTGKTSVLKAAALSALQPIVPHLGYRPYYVVRRNTSETFSDRCGLMGFFHIAKDENTLRPEAYKLATVLTVTGSESGDYFELNQVVAKVDPIFNDFIKDESPSYFLLGYGATRRSEYLENLDSQRSKRRHARFQRVAGLFEDYITLYPLSAWYPILDSEARQIEVCDVLNSLLPDGTTFTGSFKDAEALFLHNGIKLPFGVLSDGFRSYIGLVADMLYHLNYVCPKKSKLTSLSGVVMIDDIDVHLHPKWQREVVPKLAKTFPKLQFIITSHSPLVAGTLHAANIRVIEDNQIREYTERIHGLNADQILTSSYFGLDSSRSPDAEMQLAHTAKRVADTHDPAPAIEFLKELTGGANGKTTEKTKKSGKRK